MNLNKVFIIGNLVSDPELRTTSSGQPVTSFRVATNRIWKDKSGSRQEATEYHNVVAWGRNAEIITQFLKKGSQALIEGRLQTRSWQDKEGQPRWTTEIICERLQLGPRSQGTGGGGFVPKEAESPAAARAALKPAADEIPVIDLEEELGEEKEEDVPF